MSNPLIHKTAAVILCFSLNDRESFELLKDGWVEEIRENALKNVVICLAGLKSDLEHVIEKKEIDEFASTHSMTYFECCTKKNTDSDNIVAKMTQHVAAEVYKQGANNAMLWLRGLDPPR